MSTSTIPELESAIAAKQTDIDQLKQSLEELQLGIPPKAGATDAELIAASQARVKRREEINSALIMSKSDQAHLRQRLVQLEDAEVLTAVKGKFEKNRQIYNKTLPQLISAMAGMQAAIAQHRAVAGPAFPRCSPEEFVKSMGLVEVPEAPPGQPYSMR